MAWHSLAFVRTSWEFGDVLLGSVPAWIPQGVLPLGFAMTVTMWALAYVFRLPLVAAPSRSVSARAMLPMLREMRWAAMVMP